MGSERSSLSPEQLLEHTAWMGALARTLVRDSDRAEDVVQQSCLAALEAPPRSLRSATGWLRRVVRNLSYRAHREEHRRRQREQWVAKPEPILSTPVQLVERAELQHRIVEAVLKLEEPYRSTVLLRFFADMEPKRIARAHEVPVATVWTRLNRALARLRIDLDHRYGGRDWCVVPLPFAALETQAPAAAVTATATSGSASAVALSTPWTLGGLLMAQKTLVATGSIALLSLGIGLGIGRVTAPAPERDSQTVVPRAEYDAIVRQLDEERERLAAVNAERNAPRANAPQNEPAESVELAAVTLPTVESLLRSTHRPDQVRAVQRLREADSAEAIATLLQAFLSSTDPVLTAMLEEALLASQLDIGPAVINAFDTTTDARKLGRLAGMLTRLVHKHPDLEEEVVDLFLDALDYPGADGERLKAVSGALVGLGLAPVPALAEFLSDPVTNPDGSQTAAWVLTQVDSVHRDLVRDQVRDTFTSLLDAMENVDLSKESREAVHAKTQSLAWATANRPVNEHDLLSEVLVSGLARAKDPQQAQSLAWGVANLRGLSDAARQQSALSILDRLPDDPTNATRQSYVWAVSHLAKPNQSSPLDENFYGILAMAEARSKAHPDDVQLAWLYQTLKAFEDEKLGGK